MQVAVEAAALLPAEVVGLAVDGEAAAVRLVEEHTLASVRAVAPGVRKAPLGMELVWA